MSDSESDSSDVIRAVDLFCGAGGLSWGLVKALEKVALEADESTDKFLAEKIDLVGINHWQEALDVHEQNHPWARHYHDDVENVKPTEIFDGDEPDVKILSGGIECTHWSTARGGKPVKEQKRTPAWSVIHYIQRLRPRNLLFENVPEFRKWGPIDEDGQPTRNGETFRAWIDSIHSLGYNVDWKVVNAADYGDATSRERLIVMGRRQNQPEFPEPTHTEDGRGDTEEWRSAAEIIDWSEEGESIWERNRPLVENTMERIAEGLRRHGDSQVEEFADAVGQLGKEDVEEMQERVVPMEYADLVADILNEPFLVATDGTNEASSAILTTPHLVKYYGTSTARPIDAPVDTITSGGGKFGLCTPYLLGQQSGSVARDVHERPVPTIATRGYIRLFQAGTFVLPRNGYHGGLHSNASYDPSDRPLHVVTAKNHDGWKVDSTMLQFSHGGRLLDLDSPLPTITTARGGVFGLATSKITPFLDQYYGNGRPQAIDEPIPTLTTKERYALVVPDLYPFGIDIRFRMLQPAELAAAMGFEDDYQFSVDRKSDKIKLIGNAVPVNLAQTMMASLLESSTPALTDFLNDGVEEPPTSAEIETEQSVVADD